MKKKLFRYAVLLHKTDKEGNFTDTELVIEPNTMLAKNENQVLFNITRQIPESAAADPDNVEIIISSF